MSAAPSTPATAFDFGIATPSQRDAIETVDGPLLIIAGPGTGKTTTLVLRIMYLIQNRGVDASEIMVVTFTDKAARELTDRIAEEAVQRNLSINVQDMYVGTFHSVCLRILKDYCEYSDLSKNFAVIDDFQQKYQILLASTGLKGNKTLAAALNPSGSSKGYEWKRAGDIAERADRLIEELVDLDRLAASANEDEAAIGATSRAYINLLTEKGLIDYALLQRSAYDLLTKNPRVIAAIRNRIAYVMVDEYQDTNHIQEQLAFLIAGDRGNICVVGDDDQSLYRFRGATMRNILEFDTRVAKECATVKLETNFRSNPQIIDLYRTWMERTDKVPREHAFSWGNCRLDKQIVASGKPSMPWPRDGKAVVKLTCGASRDEWHRKIYELILSLKESGKITDYNQVAVLFSSVASPSKGAHYNEHSDAPQLAAYLERQTPSIAVYSPRSGAFWEREEVRCALGVFAHLFPSLAKSRMAKRPDFWSQAFYLKMKECYDTAEQYISNPAYSQLKRWVDDTRATHAKLEAGCRNADYGYAELFFQMFAYEPFRSIMGIDTSTGAYDTRPLHNLSLLVNIIVDYQATYNIAVLPGGKTRKGVSRLDDSLVDLARILGKRMENRIDEHEDELESLPSGCVSFLTIHQAKGMEFPVTIVDTSDSAPWGTQDETMQGIIERYGSGLGNEPLESINCFDFWRKYYVAFSRAKDLLILTNGAPVQKSDDCFAWLYDTLDEIDPADYTGPTWHFHDVKPSEIKPILSFTSHIAVYDSCARQYKFQKEIAFPSVRSSSTLFGSLVHQTIEDIHRAVLRGEKHTLSSNTIEKMLHANYASLSALHNEHLSEQQIKAALDQVKRYVARRKGRWDDIRETEVRLNYVAENYIITGTIDLIQGAGNTLELVDFKSESKAKLLAEPERLERYKRQLLLYAYLAEKQNGDRSISKLHLYCTGTDASDNPTISFDCSHDDIAHVAASFDASAQGILAKDFSRCSTNKNFCNNCDIRWYCKQVNAASKR